MADEPSGPGDDAADRWSESSTAGSDSGPARDSSQGDRAERVDDRIPIDLSGASDDDSDDTAATESDGYTPEASSTPIEPGDPDLENALFVLLGAIAMVLVIARLLMLPLG